MTVGSFEVTVTIVFAVFKFILSKSGTLTRVMFFLFCILNDYDGSTMTTNVNCSCCE